MAKIKRMVNTTLFSWIGVMDFDHAFGNAQGSPLTAVIEKVRPDRLVLLWTDGQKTPASKVGDFKAWLRHGIAGKFQVPEIDIQVVEGADEHLMDFSWVYGKVEDLLRRQPKEIAVMINASSGTWIMSAAWVVYAKAVGAATAQLFISSKERGVAELRLPAALKIDLRRILALAEDDPLVERYLQGSLWTTPPVLTKMVGNSAAMNRVKYQAEAVARFRIPVLIMGGPGTGKSLLAEAIHEISRGQQKMITIDCGQLHTETESHNVFGYKKGTFTGATEDNGGLIKEADDGTLFFDEVANAPALIQKGLLHFLQTKKYRPLGSVKEKDSNARIIAATNTDLYEAVRQGSFRQDLFDRLRAVLIYIPPLRERGDDIISLAHTKLTQFQSDQYDVMRKMGVQQKRLTADAEQAILKHDWPGNVRELEHLMARLVMFSDPLKTDIIGDDVRRQLSIRTGNQDKQIFDQDMDSSFRLDDVVLNVQWHYVHRAVKLTDGNRSQMAQRLGFGRSRTPLITLLKNFEDAGMPDPTDLTL
jgi:DNA-binding NtrC family response regulator